VQRRLAEEQEGENLAVTDTGLFLQKKLTLGSNLCQPWAMHKANDYSPWSYLARKRPQKPTEPSVQKLKEERSTPPPRKEETLASANEPAAAGFFRGLACGRSFFVSSSQNQSFFW
jgi:hypothetical protein